MIRPAPTDPGLQPERTVLAAVRTALSFTVIALLGVRMAGSLGGALLPVVAVGAAVVIVVVGRLDGDLRGFADSITAARGTDLGRAISRVVVFVAATTVTGATAVVAVVMA